MILDEITVFDFETTGLNPEEDRVIEMAAIRIRYGHVVSEFSTLVRQIQFESVGLPPKITEITGITTEMMSGGMDEETAFRILNRMMIGSVIVAHNAAFDLQFLHHALTRIAGRTFRNAFMDTVIISRDRHTWSKEKTHQLGHMCERYGIKLDGAHRALNDVYGCYELLKAMHAEKPVDEWLNTLAYIPKYGPPKWAPAHAKVIPMDNRYEPRGRGGE